MAPFPPLDGDPHDGKRENDRQYQSGNRVDVCSSLVSGKFILLLSRYFIGPRLPGYQNIYFAFENLW